jgi:NhaP-type Na+/H+ or K+/H+ antiporter
VQAVRKGHKATPGWVAGFFAKASLGGPLLGLLWSFLLTMLLTLQFDDAIVEVSLCLLASYSLWLLSDDCLHVSAMLALVFFAGAMGTYGRAWVSRRAVAGFSFFW